VGTDVFATRHAPLPVRDGIVEPMGSLLSNSLGIPLIMRDQICSWLAGDWLALGTHVQHWAVALAAIALIALLVAWFERPKRAPAQS